MRTIIHFPSIDTIFLFLILSEITLSVNETDKETPGQLLPIKIIQQGESFNPKCFPNDMTIRPAKAQKERRIPNLHSKSGKKTI